MQNKTGSSQIKKSRAHCTKSDTVRINLTISKTFLERIDEAARHDYTTRSDLIRVALLWYLRPQGREFDELDPDVIFKTLKQRHDQAALRKMLKNVPKPKY
jgi:metal-responsive CopG/Arc/MetJ family transcriptional regulator